MGQILFALPQIGRFHLLDRLARALSARGHEAAVLAADPVQRDFFDAQEMQVLGLRRQRSAPQDLPLTELAELDARLAGRRGPIAADVAKLAAHAAAVVTQFERSPPSLVLFLDARDSLSRLIHFVATRAGCRILHLGDGLLPHTMQQDHHGVDGEHSACGRTAGDYRDAPRDDALLAAALAAWIAGIAPQPLIRTPVAPPYWAQTPRLVARWFAGTRGAYGCWRDGWRRPAPPRPALVTLPEDPFLAVLLQADTDPRVRLDAQEQPSAGDLLAAVRRVGQHLGQDTQVLAIAPVDRLPGDLIAVARTHGVELLPAAAAATVVPSALACVTVTHPLAVGALLAGTPVVHLGRAPWALPGVTRRTTLDQLDRDLVDSLNEDAATLRERLLTRLLTDDHVWCSRDEPDHNGILGLVAAVERRIQHEPTSAATAYRAGPVWPLTPSSAAGG